MDVLIAWGSKYIVLSPGSRNSPLLIGAAARSGKLRNIMVDDERTAAFVALGLALVSQTPVALACTSGTALYNYAPAVAEAFYSRIPLVVISADRPSQWIGQDDSQTLRQPFALQNIVKKSFSLGQETGMASAVKSGKFESEREWYANRVANEAMVTATSGLKGPVHINIRYGEPLSGTEPYDADRGTRIVEYIGNNSALPPHKTRELALRLAKSRVMVVAGFMPPDAELSKAFARFAALPNVAVFCETVSNLHLTPEAHMVDSVLCRIGVKEREELRPDIVISVGGSLVSRMLKEYLRETRCEHWVLADAERGSDCFQSLSTIIDLPPTVFFKSMAGAISHLRKKNPGEFSSEYSSQWESERSRANQINSEYLDNCPWSELKAFELLLGSVPRGWNVFFSNGTPVRYAQIMRWEEPHLNWCNRGVSGIEGGNGTALGSSLAFPGTTLLVTGDMSFAYDPKIMQYVGPETDLRIVVVNNDGGGIFRFVASTRDTEIRESHFCSSPELKPEMLALCYGWEYALADSEASMMKAMQRLKSEKRIIMEIKADPQQSAGILRNFFK